MDLLYSNPFRAPSTITYRLPEPTAVALRVYDSGGRLVRELLDRFESSGVHSVIWDGRDTRGLAVASGVYFCRLIAGDFRATRKLMLFR